MLRTSSLLLVAAIALTGVGGATAYAHKSESLGELTALRALDDVGSNASAPVTTCKTVFTYVNENALNYLPTMATLNAENSVASLALRVSGRSVDERNDDENHRVEQLAIAGFSPAAVAADAMTTSTGHVLLLSGTPIAGALIDVLIH